MTKPLITTFSELLPLAIQKYERYLPTAFDDSLTMLEKVNKTIEMMGQVGEIANGLIKEWNTVYVWLLEQGLNESVSEKIDSMVADGTLNTIINDGIFTDLNTSFSSQLAYAENKYDQYNMPSSSNGGAYVSFVDDDGHKDTYSVLKPMFEGWGLKFTSAIITSYPDENVDYMSWQQIQEMNDAGFEIISHTHTHQRLGSLTPSQQIYELQTSKAQLLKRGIYPNHIAYPLGDYNDATMENVLRFYKSGLATQLSQYMDGLRPPLLEGKISRISLGSWQTLTTADIKAKIDQAILGGKWLIFTTHAWANNNENPVEGNIQAIQEILTYCANNPNVTVGTYDQGYRRYSNRNMIGNNNITNKPYKVIGADYKEYTNQTTLKPRVQLTTLGWASPPSAYALTDDITVTYKEMTASEANDPLAPIMQAGLLVTECIRLRYGYAKQTFKRYNSNEIYIRSGLDTDAWTDWEKVTSTILV